MKHIFILNPVAGKTQAALSLRGRIDAYFSRHPEEEYVIRVTESVGNATEIAAEECAKRDDVRFYACGGDGTLQETANGIPMGSQAQITVIPCGSGNDYVRIFGGKELFCQIENVIEGNVITVDAVDCDSKRSLNIASIGMDAKVCSKMTAYKHMPGVNGSLAYNLAVADTFMHPIGDTMSITIETENGTVQRRGSYLLALAANGQYYGGGYHGAPMAKPDDGILDFVLVKKIPRIRIPAFLKMYKDGKGEELDCVEHLQGFSMSVHTDAPTYCNIDGECTLGNQMNFSVLPGAYHFVVPANGNKNF